MPLKPGRPHEDSKIALFITKRINALQSRKSQREIAAEIGYEKANMISMFKRGETKVPIDKIPALAQALECDVAHLFRLAMEQYWPNMTKTVSEIFSHILTDNEAAIIDEIRRITKESDPELTSDLKKKLRESFKGV
jgi:transcriptional regulator with XRE-family HTH domain